MGRVGGGRSRVSRAAVTVLLLAVSLTGGCGSSGPRGGGSAGIRFFPQRIVDPAAENRVAFTFLVPDGWAYEGSVQWLPEWRRAAFLQTKVNDPDSGTTIEWLPIQDFIWFPAPAGLEAPIGGNYQGKMYVPPQADPVQFVADFWMSGALAHLQNASLASVTEVPEIASEFKTAFGGPAESAAYRLRYEYERDGRPWAEDVSFALLYSGSADFMEWYVNFAYTVRGPRDDLERLAGLTSTIYASRATLPDWEAIYRLVQQLFVQGIQQQMADTVAFGRTLAQHRAELQALQDQVVAERQASEDRIADLRGEVLQGVQTYDDPFTGAAVQLPIGFGTYWVNDQGQYYVADQPGFDPNSLNEGTWQQLQPHP
jgi:hypothetical protein